MSANIVAVGKGSLRKDIRNLVRRTVEEMLNALLDEFEYERLFIRSFLIY
ncbi:hypothetical protein [Collinsella aerofaciens]|nr:hypothetical protein [Collinsella aerofaciens]VWL64001.1 Uncharacterised protein [Collinsella aerofaciens]